MNCPNHGLQWQCVQSSRPLLTVAGSGVLDLQDAAKRAGRPPHVALAGVRGVVAGTHTVSGTALRTDILANGTAATSRPLVPQTPLPLWTPNVITRLGV